MASFVEPVNIIPKIPQDFHARVNSSKWKDRKETLDAVVEVVKVTPRIVDADGISDIVKALANKMPDANINVVMVAASIIGALAKGIGKPFGRFKNTVVPPMLERLKERKQSVIDALGAGLDDFFTTVSIYIIMSSCVRVYCPYCHLDYVSRLDGGVSKIPQTQESPSERGYSQIPKPLPLRHPHCPQ
jgi:cytoskeleton-associated protein 5